MAIQERDYDPAIMYGAENSLSDQVITSAETTSLVVGANGSTNPVFQVDSSASSVATGLKITGAATGTALALAAIGSATDEHLTINAKAAGTIKIGNVSTGLITLGSMVSMKRQVLASSGNTTMTSAMSGSFMLLDGATTAYTLPAIGAGDIGMFFTFGTTVASTAASITAGAADLLTGGVIAQSTTAGGADAFSPDVSDDLIISANGTTTGGVIGSTWTLTAISATRWYCEGTTIGSGTLATPFA